MRMGRSRTWLDSATAARSPDPLPAELPGIVDLDDRVVDDQPDQNDHADDRDDVDRLTRRPEGEKRPGRAHRNRDHDQERMEERFELRAMII